MQIIPEYIDLEINIIILKILLGIHLNIYEISLLKFTFYISYALSLLSLYITVRYLGNNISESEKLVLRGSMIMSVVSIISFTISLYYNNPSQILIVYSIFSLIYNFITKKGYRKYLGIFLKMFNKQTKKKFIYIKDTKCDLSCSICMDSNDSRYFVRTSCGHDYHEDCISRWTEIKSNCPNCRKTIK
jgi:hypothetical protein